MSQAPKFKTLGKPGFRLSLVRARLRSFGLTKEDAYNYHWIVSSWIQSSGIEWTLCHLKGIKSLIMALLRGQDRPDVWIASTKAGFPVAFGFLSVYPPAVLIKVANFYKAIVFDTETSPQIAKFVQAVYRHQPESSALHDAGQYIRLGMKGYAHIGADYSFSDPGPIALPKKAVKTMPRSDGKVVPRTSENFAKGLVSFFKNFNGKYVPTGPYGTGCLLQEHPDIQASYKWLGLDRHISNMGYANIEEFRKVPSQLIGTIGLSQEGGGKLRCFANPHPIVQQALTPLYTGLRLVALSDPCDFSLDQSLGHSRVIELLNRFDSVYYYDLSNATDAFPLGLQTDWMRHYGWNNNQIALFQWCAQQNWHTKGGPIQWQVGQPLGLLPSFHAFGVTHSALIRGIEVSLYEEPINCYAVVGDDVVIGDSQVATIYADIMNRIGVNTSDEKSSHGSRYVEFCGRIIDQGKLFKIGKSREVKASNFLSLGLDYGKNFTYELTRYFRTLGIKDPAALCSAVFSLPEPFGFGFGDGVPLKQRLNGEVAEHWIKSILSSFGPVKPGHSSVRQMISDVSKEFGVQLCQESLGPNSVPRFISDGAQILHYDGSTVDRVFWTYPETGISFVVPSQTMKVLGDVMRGIIRNPVDTGARFTKALRRFIG